MGYSFAMRNNTLLPQGLVQPGKNFSGLMELYESNYIRLRRLIPEITQIEESVSRVDHCLDLHVQVVERCPYTTMLRLTYAFQDAQNSVLLEPDLHLRIYHDARTAEAQSRCLRHQKGQLTVTDHSPLRAKRHLNRFLSKWLGYCLARGHQFNQESAKSGVF